MSKALIVKEGYVYLCTIPEDPLSLQFSRGNQLGSYTGDLHVYRWVIVS